MGLNKDEGRRVFLSIADGGLARQHQNPIEGVTTSRVNKNGKTVHEEFFKSLTGTLTSIKSKDTSFGRVWELTITDDGVPYVISWQYSSRYTNNFFRLLPNLDISKPFKIEPWMMKDKQDPTKKIVGLSMYQEGHDKGKVPFFYTKEEPGDMPEMKKIKVKGKESWDDSEQLEFFEEMAKSLELKLGAPVKESPKTRSTGGAYSVEDAEVINDDLPF